ncbi:MAG: DUF2178 domain-containing protein [Methanobacterium sp.]|nr:DUF2178 domain-containing protein [Methanobacterium sp.]
MNFKTLRNILITASAIQTILWITGLIFANVTLVILALIVILAVLPTIYIHRDNIGEMFKKDQNKIFEDEKTQLINEKSSTITLGALIIYLGFILVALRNIYPEFLLTGYILLITALCGVILNIISRIYYRRKY